MDCCGNRSKKEVLMGSISNRYLRSASNVILILILVALVPVSIAAQESDSDSVNQSGTTIGLSAVYSPNSFEAWGKIQNSRSFSLKGQFWFSEFQFENFSARLGSEIIITQHLKYPVNGIDGPRDQRLGFGIIPLNVLTPIGNGKVKPFTFFSAGLLFLNDKLPAGDGASMNYLLNLGTGIEFQTTSRTVLQIGYNLQHLSNANSALLNPGIDYHNFFFTLIFL